MTCTRSLPKLGTVCTKKHSNRSTAPPETIGHLRDLVNCVGLIPPKTNIRHGAHVILIQPLAMSERNTILTRLLQKSGAKQVQTLFSQLLLL